MRKNLFLILCTAVLLVLVSGGVIKHTLLRETRSDRIWPYPVTYTVKVSDVEPDIGEMFFLNMALYLEDRAAAGYVTRMEWQPAASGAENCSDLILHVKATAAGDTSRKAEPVTFQTDKPETFVNRFITFSGVITGIEGD